MPAKKKPVKKSPQSKQNSKGKNTPGKERGGDSTRLIHQVLPYILGILALFILISYFIADSTGFLGGFLRNLFFGLFSGAAWCVPFLVLNIAIFWKRDVNSGSVGYKLIFSILCCSFIAVLIHSFFRNAALEGVQTFNLIELFKLGLDAKGGGAIGGLLGNALWYALGFAGVLIFSIALILLFGIFLFGMTPRMLVIQIITAFREWRSGLSERISDVQSEEERMIADYEIKRREKMAQREAERQAAAEKRKAKNRKSVEEYIGVEDEENTNFYDAESEVDEDYPDDPANDTPYTVGVSNRTPIAPMPLTGAQELSEMDNGEIDLSKIFVDPGSNENNENFMDNTGADIVTSAEIDLMVEKSKLSQDEISADNFGEDDPSDESDVYAEITNGTVKMEPMQIPDYTFPPLSLLKFDTSGTNVDLSGEIQQTATKLVETLRSFNVKTKIINVSRGPTITRYELQPEVGTKVRSILNLVDDIALHLATSGVRIEAPIPGKEAVGIEVPNRSTSTVYIRELLENDAFEGSKSRVTTGLGVDVAGNPIYLDIAKMPHLLIAGTTGSGKSVCINSLIISMLYKARPDEVKFILIDPKKVELNVYNGIPHLLVPVVSDPKKAAGSLHWAVTEMERRYELIEGAGVRNIKGYNDSIANDPDAEKLPQIVIIIDELADLMMTAKDDVEEAICRIAQKARAAGMHLIIGTQRPSVDVITGLIKANVPSRIAFTTVSQIDSRTIIDVAGAEKLIGRGDMLFSPVGSIKPMRVQGSFVSDDEVEAVTTFIKNNYGTREYDQSVIDSIEREAQLCGNKKSTVLGDGDEEANDGDPMLRPAIQLAVESGKISTSLIQRRLQLGYGRAAKLIDTMEQMGIVSAPQGQKPRDVLISKEEYMEMELRRGE